MVKSKTKIENQLKRKTSPELIQTIILAKKNSAWAEVASLLTAPSNKRKNYNLSEIDKAEGNTIIVAGKVLSQGDLKSGKKIIAMNFSENAKKKILESGCKCSTIVEEIKNNKEAKGVIILK